MVKGSTRQVVLVKSTQEPLFEQAIFFVKEDALRRPDLTADSVVAEAKKAAENYIHRDEIFYSTGGIHGLLWVLLGASGASVLWAMALYFLL